MHLQIEREYCRDVLKTMISSPLLTPIFHWYYHIHMLHYSTELLNYSKVSHKQGVWCFKQPHSYSLCKDEVLFLT